MTLALKTKLTMRNKQLKLSESKHWKEDLEISSNTNTPKTDYKGTSTLNKLN